MMHRSVKRCAAAVILAVAVPAGAPAMAATHEVDVANFVFTPDNVDVLPGDTIHWTWSNGFHSVTSGPWTCVPDGRFDSTPMAGPPGPEFSYVVPADEPAGQIPYFCIPHCPGWMRGTITVAASPDPIPTMSEWGAGVMALLVLSAGTVAFGVLRRRVATAGT